INNENLEWKVVGQYLFDGTVLTGVLYTVALTIITMAIGIVLGTILAIMRRSSNMLLSSIAQAYVWIFRTIPPLVQLLIWYNLAAVYPNIVIKLPFGPELLNGDANNLITPFIAALLGLGLNESAYMCEVIRAGFS